MSGIRVIAYAFLGSACLVATAASADQSQPLRQLPTTKPTREQPPVPALQGDQVVRQPSNLELRLQIDELNRKVDELAALLTRLSQREADRYRTLDIAVNRACKAANLAWNSQGDGEASADVAQVWCLEQDPVWVGEVPGAELFTP